MDKTTTKRTVWKVNASSLARAYRPKFFSDVAGQKAAKTVLSAAATSERPVQQIMIAGPSGTGKTTLARIYAAALFCEAGGPCGECASCQMIASGNHPDLFEVDAASHGGVEAIRGLADIAGHAPALGQWRVFIIDEAHGISSAGSQAFLKLLEEPPGHTIFILATTDPHKLPVALRSRCLHVYVHPLEAEELAGNLQRVAKAEGYDLDEQSAKMVIAATDPELGVRGTLMTLEKLMSMPGQDPADVLGVARADTVADLVEAVLDGYTQLTVQLAGAALKSTLPAQLRVQVQERLLGVIEHSLDETRCADAALTLATVDRSERSRAGLISALARSAADVWNAQYSQRQDPPPPSSPGKEEKVQDDSGAAASSPATPHQGKGEEPPGEPPAAQHDQELASSPASSEQVLTLAEVLNAVAAASPRYAVELRRAGMSFQPGQVSIASDISPQARQALVEAFPHLRIT